MLVENKCIFCEGAKDSIWYPSRIEDENFNAHTFSARRLRRREHYQIVICQRCGLARSNPILEENRIEDLYRQSHFLYSDQAPYVAETYANLLADLMKRHIKISISSCLEIGSGTGFFMEKALKMGFHEVVGFEPSRECFSKASADIKEKIINQVYDPARLEERTFDLACGFHVFDHLPNPLKALISLKGCLNPEGYLLIVCHDVRSWSAKLLGSYSPIFDVEHIFLFSQETIRLLFERAGFQLLEMGSLANRYPLAYWMQMLTILNRVAHTLPPFLRKLPITLRGGNLYAFGRKR